MKSKKNVIYIPGITENSIEGLGSGAGCLHSDDEDCDEFGKTTNPPNQGNSLSGIDNKTITFLPGSLYILVASFFVFWLSWTTKIIFHVCLLTPFTRQDRQNGNLKNNQNHETKVTKIRSYENDMSQTIVNMWSPLIHTPFIREKMQNC